MSWMRWTGLAIYTISIAMHAQNVTTNYGEHLCSKASLDNECSRCSGMGDAPDDIPTLTTYLPSSNPTHTAVIVVPGGGYQHLALDHEGAQVARWLNAHGIAAFVLQYRLDRSNHHPVRA